MFSLMVASCHLNMKCKIELGWNHETERTRPLRERCVFLRSLRAFTIY